VLQSLFVQFFQPYFFFSLILLAAAYISIAVFLRFGTVSHRTRSLLLIAPLVIPAFIFIAFPPQLSVTELVRTPLESVQSPFFTLSSTQAVAVQTPVTLTLVSFVTVPSVTGILCISAAVLCVSLFAVQVLFSEKFIKRLFRFISLSSNDYPELQVNVSELAQKLSISAPRIGLIEDLRPNAFTVGYGRKTMVVFSTGLLDVVNEEELSAVIAHELAHIKNHDFLFKTFSSALTALCFYNPLAYFASSAAQREREFLADEKGVRQVTNPTALSSALAKISGVFKSLPKERTARYLAANLLVRSSLLRRPNILSSHPQLNQRLSNISGVNQKAQFNHRKALLAALLSILLVLASAAIIYQAAGVQQQYLSDNTARPFFKDYMFKPLDVSAVNVTTAAGLSYVGGTITTEFNATQAPITAAADLSPVFRFNQTLSVGQLSIANYSIGQAPIATSWKTP
jgi:heat shock protein HtpX